MENTVGYVKKEWCAHKFDKGKKGGIKPYNVMYEGGVDTPLRHAYASIYA